MTARTDDDGIVKPLDAERGPTVLRIALGGNLRRLREDRGVSREAAADAIRGSDAKISRLELGRTGFKERDIRDLLALYGVTDTDECRAYLDLARQANKPGWWQSDSDLLPPWFETYIGLEQAANTIRTYESQLIPGLLQTADYARAVIELGFDEIDDDEIDRRVAVRMRRQRILTRAEPTMLWAVVDEGALHRPVGDVGVLRGQIEHLVTMSRLPNITVQVLPFSAGGHAAAGGSFSILRFAEPELPDVVYVEQLTSSLYLDKRRDVETYLTVMNTISVQAEPAKTTADFLTTLLAELWGT